MIDLTGWRLFNGPKIPLNSPLPNLCDYNNIVGLVALPPTLLATDLAWHGLPWLE